MDFETCAVAGCFSFTGPSIYIYYIVYMLLCYYIVLYIQKSGRGFGILGGSGETVALTQKPLAAKGPCRPG